MKKTNKDFMTEDFDYVSYRLTLRSWKNEYLNDEEKLYENSIFAGYFAIKNGSIIPLDGDIYSEDTEILEYEEWSDEEEGIKNGLTVVYEGHWI